jgi:hypothetical protein
VFRFGEKWQTNICRFEGGSLVEIEGCLRRASVFHYIKRGDF